MRINLVVVRGSRIGVVPEKVVGTQGRVIALADLHADLTLVDEV
jgi:hypothetical protein